MDKDYLEDYKAKEAAFYQRFVDDIFAGRFIIHQSESPYKRRYQKIQDPITELHRSNLSRHQDNMWPQIPFSGSSILALPAFSEKDFEDQFFDVGDIPRIVDFIKETGRLQFALSDDIINYEGLDYLDPIFQELKPPAYHLTPMGTFASDEEIREARNTFRILASINFAHFLDSRGAQGVPMNVLMSGYNGAEATFTTLKLIKSSLVEEAENLIVDNPPLAIDFLSLANIFIEIPSFNLMVDSHNYPLDRIKAAKGHSDGIYQVPHFQHEIGKFLLSKLTYAPSGMDACKEIMYNYDKYDLQKVQAALNEGITTNNPQAVNSNSKELSEILDNVWTDKTIPRRIKGLKIGMPLSMAAIGAVAAGPIGATGGLLASIGFEVASEILDINTEGLSEKLAKIKTKSYQANIFDFQSKYQGRLVKAH